MDDRLLDRRVAGARADLVRALDPSPPGIEIVQRRRHGRRRLAAACAVLVMTVAGVSIIGGADDGPSDVRAGQESTSTQSTDRPLEGDAYAFPPLTPLLDAAPVDVIGDTTVIETPEVTYTASLAPDHFTTRLTIASMIGSGGLSGHPMATPAITFMQTSSDALSGGYLSGITRAEVVSLELLLRDRAIETVDTVSNVAFPALRFFVVAAPDGASHEDLTLRAYGDGGELLTDTDRIKTEEQAFFAELRERDPQLMAGLTGDGASEHDVNIPRTISQFARNPGDESFAAIPFADTPIRLLLNGEPITAVQAAELRDPAVWSVDTGSDPALRSVLTALGALDESELVYAPGPYGYCAASPPFDLVHHDEHIIVEPAAIDSCADWFGVDVYLADGRIVGLNLQDATND